MAFHGSCLLIECLICQLLCRAHYDARWTRFSPTCDDHPDCPYDERKVSGNIIKPEKDKKFFRHLEASNIIAASGKEREKVMKSFAFVGTAGLQVASWSWLAAVSHHFHAFDLTDFRRHG